MMNFFSFGKNPSNFRRDNYFLDTMPLFQALTSNEQSQIERAARLIGFHRGDRVYNEGDKADAFYIIVSGRFRLFTHDYTNKKETNILYFYRGEHFGETSLLTGNPHSASVEAATDATVLKIEAAKFQKLLKEIPSLSIYLSRALGRHLTREELGYSSHRREVRIASVFTSGASAEVFAFLKDFAKTIGNETKHKVLLLNLFSNTQDFSKQINSKSGFDFETMDPSHKALIHSQIEKNEDDVEFINFQNNDALENEDEKFAAFLTYLTYKYDYLILLLPDKKTKVVSKALSYSDRAYLLTNHQINAVKFILSKTKMLMDDFGFNKKEIKALVESAADEFQIFCSLPDLKFQRYKYEKSLVFLAKDWAERLVGLALGSGAAYGLAHIGVLRVIEEEKIPIDIISGTSIGALIGVFWSAGYDSYEIEKIAKSINKKTAFFKLVGFMDFSNPYKGFLKGKQIMRFLESYLGHKTFKDLQTPLKISATNLLTAEEKIFDDGDLLSAVRASISIPGFFRPVKHEGSYLIDGGIVDPLPVRVLSNMGARKILAVNVLPSPQDLLERNNLIRQRFHAEFQKRKHLQKMLMKWKDGFFRNYEDNIFNVLMNSIMYTEFEVARMEGEEADVFINAATLDANWAEFFSADKFIDEGIKKTRERLPEIKQLIDE